jgi:excisionase family DNA binding protein
MPDKPTLDRDKLYNLSEVAQLCGVHVVTVRHWVKFGELPAKRIGRRWFVYGRDLVRADFDEKDVSG